MVIGDNEAERLLSGIVDYTFLRAAIGLQVCTRQHVHKRWRNARLYYSSNQLRRTTSRSPAG